MSEQPFNPGRLPSAFDLDQKFIDPVASARHWIYDIFNRSQHLYDIEDITMTKHGELISYEVDTSINEAGKYQSLRIREPLYSLVKTVGDSAVLTSPGSEAIDRTVKTYVVESIDRNSDESDLSLGVWKPFVALIIDHDGTNGVDMFMCNPDTGREFMDLEKVEIQYLLQGMSGSLMEEMASQIILTDPDHADFDSGQNDKEMVDDFNPHIWIANGACNDCEATGIFCEHQAGNLN
jgi:hypothetical protein